MAAIVATTLCRGRNSMNIVINKQKNFQSSHKCFSKMKVKVKAAEVQIEIAASGRRRRPQNVDGDLFVDHTCIDCDTCRWMAPGFSAVFGPIGLVEPGMISRTMFLKQNEIFSRVDGMSAVFKQPSSEQERLKALQALLSCPTSSIRTEFPPSDILEVQKTFPIPIDEQRLPGIYHCGYHSEKSYGAASYLIFRPEGNILIDSPRYTGRLADNIKKMGGARYMFLTHKDDVADHEKWSEQLKCDRILHLEDVNLSTVNVEIKLEGTGPWSLDDDITLIHTPGHTKGSVCLFLKSKKVLFAGDHLFMKESSLAISEIYNFFSVPIQLENVRKLLELDFEWILPGHGRRAEFKNVEEKNTILDAFLASKASHA